jgi:hypothetical protein
LLLLFGGVGGFLCLFVVHAQVWRLVPLVVLTAIGEGIGLFGIAMGMEPLLLVSPRWLQDRRYDG